MAKSLCCQKYIYERLFDLVDHYNSKTKELILNAKANELEKMKSKKISAKHLCLLHNCLSLLSKLIQEFSQPELKELRKNSLENIEWHKKKLIEKLADLLKKKVESTINLFFSSK